MTASAAGGEGAMSYACGTATEPLLGHTIGADLDATAARFPHRHALVECWTGRRWTYRELCAEVDALSLGLLAAGVHKGERVGIWAPNCAEWVFVQYATAKIGAILTTVNPAYKAAETAHVLRLAEVGTLITAREYKGADFRAMVDEVRTELKEPVRLLVIGSPEWEDLLERGRAADPGRLAAAQRDCAADDPINIQFTSGTSGFPKGATLTHHGILNNAYFVGGLLGYTEADRLCLPVPLFHCFGMVLGTLACTARGATIVLPAPGFDAAATLDAIEAERCTSVYGVPTMFLALLADPALDRRALASLRTGIMAGAPCPPSLLELVASRLGATGITTSYGMTETSPTAVQTSFTDPLSRRVGTVGPPLPYVEVKVVDPVGDRIVPRGTAGEICVRGYLVMQGYWRQPDRTAEAVDGAGWMHTGDTGTMTTDGCLVISGRITDMVIRGGENIYPREIEDFLRTHPGVHDVAVVGVPDPRVGEELMAWVVRHPGTEPLTADAMRAYCEGRIAHYKIPRYVQLTDAFPMTASGKVRKAELRAAAAQLTQVPAGAAAPREEA
ncbi:Long-chain-fatty-acid--CoA ligase [Streptomyces sp. YIM 130001]|uniref:AMP-binding protein n=1 Tax=Streptomyces sp. YIM 130001 TaxID=2259644 RepID=UPI000ED00ECA|nr:AMP-binding protein [Streptomyces sp. YIM 130001]RII11158.1 Long-chain-fatty-acid--CoA ligase [Streptomyces sp. YIM 130001]